MTWEPERKDVVVWQVAEEVHRDGRAETVTRNVELAYAPSSLDGMQRWFVRIPPDRWRATRFENRERARNAIIEVANAEQWNLVHVLAPGQKGPDQPPQTAFGPIMRALASIHDAIVGLHGVIAARDELDELDEWGRAQPWTTCLSCHEPVALVRSPAFTATEAPPMPAYVDSGTRCEVCGRVKP